MSSTSTVNAVRAFLASHHMLVDEDWLVGCVDFLSNDTESNYSDSDIKALAKEQWLLNDLKIVSTGSLPRNLKDQQKTVLTGKFVLQINSAIDIGTPAYQQYLKLQKINMENVEATTNFEERISSHRMIKLTLTDGVQEITAIEDKPMRNLSCDITPGYKVLIKGPIECRKGILRLTENSVELLGGEVQEIIVSNSLAGLLSTKLGVTITSGPQRENLNTTINQPRNQHIPTLHETMPPATIHTSDAIEQNFVEDDIDIDQLAAIEAQFTDISAIEAQFSGNPATEAQVTGNHVIEAQVTGNHAIEAQFTENPAKRSFNSNLTNPQKKFKTESVNNSDDYPDEHDLICEEDEEYLKEIEAEIEARQNGFKSPPSSGPNCVSAEPFVYIKQLQNISECDRIGQLYKVKGQVMAVLQKLSISQQEWSLKCTISDGTGQLDVEFASDVVSKLVGITPQEMKVMKTQMSKKPDLKEKIVTAMKNAKDKLEVLYCIMEIAMYVVPKITDYKPFDCSHVEMLKRRVT